MIQTQVVVSVSVDTSCLHVIQRQTDVSVSVDTNCLLVIQRQTDVSVSVDTNCVLMIQRQTEGVLPTTKAGSQEVHVWQEGHDIGPEAG